MDVTEAVLVSLDALIQKEGEIDQQEAKEILLKKVPKEYMEKNVREIVVYVTDSSSDSLNPGYNRDEQIIAALVKGWMDKAATPGTKFIFNVRAKPANGGEPILLNLDSRVDTYANQILQRRPVPGQDPSITVPYIELYASGKDGGALLIRYFTRK